MKRTARVYHCIECGAVVGRRIKRCPPCNAAFLKVRPTYERTPEHRAKMSAVTTKPKPHLRGRKRPEVAKKIAAAWDEGKKEAARERGRRMAQDREWLLRVAESVTGERNPRWMGGIANGQYAPGFCKSLKERIRARDGHTCQLCGKTEDELGYRLSIHHSDYDKSNHAESNLFATCKRCNSAVNTRRDFWTAFFRDLARRRQLL